MIKTPEIFIPIDTSYGRVELIISEEEKDTLFTENPVDAMANGEASCQLKEGKSYEYKLTKEYTLKSPGVVFSSRLNPSSGRITPGVYVGTLIVPVYYNNDDLPCGEVQLEVQSDKTEYRTDYRQMLEDITEKCTNLLLQHSSPAHQYFEVDFNADSKTLYQRFAFLRSIIDSSEFNDAVYKVLSSPVTTWEETATVRDIRTVRKVNSNIMRQIASGSNRVQVPVQHSMNRIMYSLPVKVWMQHLKESIDAPVNQFVKYVLNTFLAFISDFKTKLKNEARVKLEATLLEEKLEQWLNHNVFKEISNQNTCPLNNPVLQRKAGYREILRTWLMFDLAAKLVWHGGDDVYRGSKRDVAVLYEYWLFFKLLEVVESIFKVEPRSLQELIKPTNDGLGLQLRQGKHLLVKGIYDKGPRKLNIEFSYNRTFSGGSIYPKGGSWSRTLRPDYTLSIYPLGLSAEKAEEEELIAHIHFDAKYKIEKLQDIFGEQDKTDEQKMDEEREQNKQGSYQKADLLKMHTYRDAIRRTAGAYVLYPGDAESYTPRGFHELIPGLGAFAVKPSIKNNGTHQVKDFIVDIVKHFMNRTSQREKIALKTYQTYKDKNNTPLEELLPEVYGDNRSLLPDETFVLIAYYKNEEHLQWILQNKLYNARTGSGRGALQLSSKETEARYILLRGSQETKTNRLFKLKPGGPKILSRPDLVRKGYPSPSQEFYLVYEIGNEVEKEYVNYSWNVKYLAEFKRGRAGTIPFAVQMSDLMRVRLKL